MSKQRGFSLIELLIVVAIILIIAAIAIPNLMRARIAANESAAVGSLRVLNTAAATYSTAYPKVGYAATLADMAGNCVGVIPTSTNACILDNGLATANVAPGKDGYLFAYAGTSGTYAASADPNSPGSSGIKHYYTNQDGVIRFNSNAAAAATDPGI
jgi:type IV pilus assembly protein PilA